MTATILTCGCQITDKTVIPCVYGADVSFADAKRCELSWKDYKKNTNKGEKLR